MNTFNKNYIHTSYQGIYEILPNDGYSVMNTFHYVKSIIHSWIIKKFPDDRIPPKPKIWSWSGISRSIDIYFNTRHKIYCIKVVHADSEVAGRMWTVEATLFIKEEKLFLASRTSYTSEDRNRNYQLCSVPKFISSIAQNCRMCDAGVTLYNLRTVRTTDDVEMLYLIVNDRNRLFPVIVISEDQSQDEDVKYLQSQEEGYHIDGAKLAQDLKQIAHIYYLPHEFQKKWVDMMTPEWAVGNGAVRTYNPGFDIEDESMTVYDHPIALPRNILPMNYINEEGREFIAGHAFRHLLTHKIKYDNMYRKINWEEYGVRFLAQLLKEADIEAENDINKLRQELIKCKHENDELKTLNAMFEEDNDAKLAEVKKKQRENIINQQRIFELKNLLKKFENYIPVEYPKEYKEIPDWVRDQFAGRVELHKKALKCLKDNPQYEDIELLCKAIELLGKEYHDMKTGRIGISEYDAARLSLGIENSLTGSVASAGRKGESYMVDYNGGRRRLDMHIKGGKSMNSSDPRERFRIYYFWDDDDQRVVIGYLPDHLPLSGI